MPPSADTQTIVQSQASATALLLLGVVLFLGGVTERPIGRWEPATLLALSACTVLTWCVIRRRRRKVVLWDGGFVLIGRRKAPEPRLWRDVAEIRWSSDDQTLECVSADESLVMSIPVDFFGTSRRAERFRQTAQTLIMRSR